MSILDLFRTPRLILEMEETEKKRELQEAERSKTTIQKLHAIRDNSVKVWNIKITEERE